MTDFSLKPVRLDVFLFENGFSQSRQKAQTLIKLGAVKVNGKTIKKTGYMLENQPEITIDNSLATELKYVSRGGLKLEKAIDRFKIDLSGKICADIGASSGGFCDCMLQNGAVKVYAIDVGIDQLDEKIKNDSKVVNLEKTDFRNCTREQISEPLDFASVDVSFISLEKILPTLFIFLKDGANAVCLIKPQFEVGKENVGKNGVVKSRDSHIYAIEKIRKSAVDCGFSVKNLDFSPIKGPMGNIEYLIFLEKTDLPLDVAENTELTVNNSYNKL